MSVIEDAKLRPSSQQQSTAGSSARLLILYAVGRVESRSAGYSIVLASQRADVAGSRHGRVVRCVRRYPNKERLIICAQRWVGDAVTSVSFITVEMLLSRASGMGGE